MRFADQYGWYELHPFPGNNQVCVSTNAFIRPLYRDKGFGQAQHQARLQQARMLGYDYIICTVREDNAREQHILRKFCWHHLDAFPNMMTNAKNQLWGKAL